MDEGAGRTVVVKAGGVHGHERALGDGDGALLASGVGGGERCVLRALLGDGDHRREQPQGLVEHAVRQEWGGDPSTRQRTKA